MNSVNCPSVLVVLSGRLAKEHICEMMASGSICAFTPDELRYPLFVRVASYLHVFWEEGLMSPKFHAFQN
jgi:hypothetical protein